MIAPDITRLSPNVNRDFAATPIPMPASCRTVIIHTTRSGVSMNPSEFEGTLNYMERPGTVSSHWVIARDGRKARVVPDGRQAWHASEDNDNAWGIECEQGVEDDGFTDEQLAALVEVCKGYRDDFGVPPVHARTSTQGGFIGHQETAQGRRDGKSDPGHLFPWDWFIAQLQPQAFVGVGIHYTDNTGEDLWEASEHDGKTPDGIGLRLDDGSIKQIWP